MLKWYDFLHRPFKNVEIVLLLVVAAFCFICIFSNRSCKWKFSSTHFEIACFHTHPRDSLYNYSDVVSETREQLDTIYRKTVTPFRLSSFQIENKRKMCLNG